MLHAGRVCRSSTSMVQSYSNVVSVEVKSLDVLRQHGGNMSWLDVWFGCLVWGWHCVGGVRFDTHRSDITGHEC